MPSQSACCESTDLVEQGLKQFLASLLWNVIDICHRTPPVFTPPPKKKLKQKNLKKIEKKEKKMKNVENQREIWIQKTNIV